MLTSVVPCDPAQGRAYRPVRGRSPRAGNADRPREPARAERDPARDSGEVDGAEGGPRRSAHRRRIGEDAGVEPQRSGERVVGAQGKADDGARLVQDRRERGSGDRRHPGGVGRDADRGGVAGEELVLVLGAIIAHVELHLAPGIAEGGPCRRTNGHLVIELRLRVAEGEIVLGAIRLEQRLGEPDLAAPPDPETGRRDGRPDRDRAGEVPLHAPGEQEMVNGAVGRERPDPGDDTGRRHQPILQGLRLAEVGHPIARPDAHPHRRREPVGRVQAGDDGVEVDFGRIPERLRRISHRQAEGPVQAARCPGHRAGEAEAEPPAVTPGDRLPDHDAEEAAHRPEPGTGFPLPDAAQGGLGHFVHVRAGIERRLFARGQTRRIVPVGQRVIGPGHVCAPFQRLPLADATRL